MTSISEILLRDAEAVVSDFLQSVVLIDDEAFRGWKDCAPTSISEPGKKVVSQDIEHTDDVVAKRPSYGVNANEIIKSFAQKGLICSVFQPDSTNIVNDVSQVVKKADVVILDWEIYKSAQEYGEETYSIQILKEMLKSDEERFRFICIYSGLPDISGIIEKLKSTLKFKVVEGNEERKLSKAGNTILVLSKGNRDDVDNSFVVSEENLAEKIIKEFSKASCGLVSNSIIKGLSYVRKNINKILLTFKSDIDIPFVGHCMLSVPIEDTKYHLAPLLSDEINSILAQSGMHSGLSKERLKMLISDPDFCTITCEDNEKEGVTKIIDFLFEHGGDSTLFKSKFDKKDKKLFSKYCNSEHLRTSSFTKLLGAEDPSNGDKRLAEISICERLYSQDGPVLTLGTIIKFEEKYYICIQPACDSTRISGCRAFPFLPLQIVNEGKKFDFVVKDEKFETLQLSDKPSELKMLKFYPTTDSGDIGARRRSGKWIFKLSTLGALPRSKRRRLHRRRLKKFQSEKQAIWIGQLKDSHSHRLAQRFASQLSRVGVTESEWLRRCGK